MMVRTLGVAVLGLCLAASAHAEPATSVAPGDAARSGQEITGTPAAPKLATPGDQVAQDPVKAKINGATLADKGVKDGVDPAVLRAEVMLDRLNVSPGVIDGKPGSNFVHALRTFEKQNGLADSKVLDEAVFKRLVEQSGDPVLVDYTLNDADVAGPFFPDLPKNYAKLAELKTIGYRDVAQKLGAKFHMGEDLLASLNPGVDLGKSGTHILVADITAQAPRGRVRRIFVDKRLSQVLGYDADGRVLIALPATIGSRELPSPSGTYKVKGVSWNPIYYYNPKNFVQGDNKTKLKLPPGPNNPVGTVFIALTKPTYGLHGTPDPSAIDKTASHGCVRMTNWDATELAHLVRPGVKVSFGRSK